MRGEAAANVMAEGRLHGLIGRCTFSVDVVNGGQVWNQVMVRPKTVGIRRCVGLRSVVVGKETRSVPAQRTHVENAGGVSPEFLFKSEVELVQLQHPLVERPRTPQVA